MSLKYDNPLIYERRSGKSDDPFIVKSESHKIINGNILLDEIPVQLNRVQIASYFEVINKTSHTLESNQFLVDYPTGIISFSSTEEGKTLVVNYYGAGVVLIPDSRIYISSSLNNGSVTQTLNEIIQSASNFVSKGVYNPSTVYSTFNIVSYNGSTYMYTAKTSSSGNVPTNTTYWTKIAGSSNRGTYSTSTSYSINDVVVDSINQNVYQSLIESNLNNPLTDTTKWQLLVSVQSAVTTVNTTNTNVVNAESGRVTAESSRVTAETGRVTAEGARASAESTRVSSESTRQTQETTRQTNETTRQSGFAAYIAIEAYNNTKSYVPLNKVTYNGSTYQCIVATTGNVPTNTTYWLMIAAAGANGAGTVATIVSTNNDVVVGGTAQTPDLSINTGNGSNKIAKRDANGNLTNIGNQSINISADTALTYAQSGIVNVTTGATNKTITLPSAVTSQILFTIKKADSGLGVVNIVTTSSQTIDGISSKTLANQYADITLVSDGSKWIVEFENYYDQVFANPTATSMNLVNGQQVVSASKTSPYNVLNIVGNTLVNLLGRDGNCEDLSKWTTATVTLAFDSINKTVGANSIVATLTSATGAIYISQPKAVNNTKYYLMAADIRNIDATNVSLLVTKGSNNTTIKTANGVPTVSFSLCYTTLAPADLGSETSVYAFLNIAGTTGKKAAMDGVRLYEITAAEKIAIDAMTVVAAQAYIAAKYPYVDDVKHVNAPYVIKYGENLIPPFNEWALHANAVAIEPYKLTLNGTAGNQSSTVIIPSLENTTYTYSGTLPTNTYAQFDFLDVNNSVISVSYALNFTTPIGTKSIRVVLQNTATIGTYTFSNPMLNLGSTAKSFKPRNDDMLAFPNVQLASSVDGTVYDTLFKRDGKYFVEKRFKDTVLDGSLAAAFGADFTGYKGINITIGSVNKPNGYTNDIYNVVKYDGKILKSDNGAATTSDYAVLYDNGHAATGKILISIADTDSGWGETYTPSTAEIQAYFYGWRMAKDTDWGAKYDGVGGRVWLAISGSTNAVATLPITYASSFTTWKPYKLSYQLATPTFEEIQVDAGMSLHEGLNQIEVGQGGVVREKANPYVHVNGNSYINAGDIGSSKLKNRVDKVLSIYKNGKRDDQWIIFSDAYSNGKYTMRIPTPNFDPTATYEVSYTALDQYLLSAPVQVVNGEVASNLKTVVDQLAINQADADARISANEIVARKIYDVMTSDALKAPINNPKFTGDVILSANPTTALGAATKQMVDAAKATADAALPITGGDMTGSIKFRADAPLDIGVEFWNAAGTTRKGFVDSIGSSGAVNGLWIHNQVSGKTLRLLDTGILEYAGNRLWDDGRMRTTNGYVEFYNGSTWQGAGGIKGVQRGITGAADTTVTISAVNMSKSFVTFNNFGSMRSDTYAPYRAVLTSPTTLAIGNAAGNIGSGNLAWEVVEFY
ncbi:hypothetical protein BC351_00255 [Paenibacillus ferrarius]|uniref:Chitin-binding type-3 domain-containing protein n=1 Tax=Paenibacillus ferrarius TaxID=1469647 RepID=A0A1V4HRY6_9BACL|nr:hypothetical protein [Paenibacillus ferrarius]OPH61709.1 hypothetical protein BC351_00255 [Paenibacillus ferrarius]